MTRRAPPSAPAATLGAALWSLLLLSAALAQEPIADPVCPPDGGPTLELEGFGTVRFGEFATDAADDSAEFYGGVCVVGPDDAWRLEAQRMAVAGLEAERPTLTVERALIRLGNIELRSRAVVSRGERLRFEGVALAGTDLVGTATRGAYDFSSDTLELQQPRLRTRSAALSGSRARFDGGVVTLFDGTLTTCVCDPTGAEGDLAAPADPSFAVEGSTIRLVVDDLRATVEDATVRVGEQRYGFGRIVLGQNELAAFQLPLSLAVPTGDERLADSLTLLIGALQVGAGVELTAGLAELDRIGSGGIVPVARIDAELPEGERDGGAFRAASTVTFPVGGLRHETNLARRLAPGVDLRLGTRQDLRFASRATVDSSVAVRFATDLDLAPEIDASASATPRLAASADRVDGQVVAGARLLLGGAFRVAAEPASWLDVALAADTEVAHYPNAARDDPLQAWVRLRPSLRAEYGPLRAFASYDLRVVAGRSPFSSRIDRVGPRHRLALSARVAGPLGGLGTGAGEALPEGTSGEIAAQMRLRLAPEWSTPGVDRLRASAELRVPAAGGRATVAAEARLEGALGPDPDLADWLEGRAAWVGPDERAESSLRLRWDLGEGRLVDATVAAAWPLARGGVTLTPYLALDLADLARGASPLVGHGAELDWRGCCGALTVGYRFDGDATRVTLLLGFPEVPLDPRYATFDAVPPAPEPEGDPEIPTNGPAEGTP